MFLSIPDFLSKTITLIIPFKSILKVISIIGIPILDTLSNSNSPINVFLFAIFLSP